MVASLARYLWNDPGEALHVLHRVGVAQLDRPLPVLSCTAHARGHALSLEVHAADLVLAYSDTPLTDPWTTPAAGHNEEARRWIVSAARGRRWS